jgi:hypothetical protein
MMGGYRWNRHKAIPITCQLIFFSGKVWFANKSMKPIQGYHLIKPEDLFWRPSNRCASRTQIIWSAPGAF